MDPIKEAFLRIKEDMARLREEINSIRHDLVHIQTQTTPAHNPTITSTQTDNSTDRQATPTHNYSLEPLKDPNMPFSIGNRGVPTDRQTDQQTNQQTQNTPNLPVNQEFRKAGEILNSLDSIKKGIRLKFKRLTPQELLVFSTLYSLEEQSIEEITYKILANNLSLSESSIRDYINKLTKKGIPIDKIRQNNKTILLKISQDLKNVATLETILHLREI